MVRAILLALNIGASVWAAATQGDWVVVVFAPAHGFAAGLLAATFVIDLAERERGTKARWRREVRGGAMEADNE